MDKKINLADSSIQIRILKALGDIRPFGPFRHFYVVQVMRGLKKPNVIGAKHIWEFLEQEFELQRYNEKANEEFGHDSVAIDQIFEG